MMWLPEAGAPKFSAEMMSAVPEALKDRGRAVGAIGCRANFCARQASLDPGA